MYIARSREIVLDSMRYKTPLPNTMNREPVPQRLGINQHRVTDT